MSEFKFIATAAFGLEATVKREVIKLGYENVKVQNGRVDFTGDINAIAECNINLRASDRLLLNMGSFYAYSFDELFEAVKAINWEAFITKDGKFTVNGKSVKSQLHSVPDVQSIVKKAIVERLKQTYNVEWFSETGPEYTVQAAILNDLVTLTIDTTGVSLHKRGYRGHAVAAPIKETMAFAMIELSYWRKDRILLDPFCGSGTIPIEAAMYARNIAPGLYRSFASEKWPQIPARSFKDARAQARAAINSGFMPDIFASDSDGKAIEAARANAEKAGVGDAIHFENMPVSGVSLPGDYGVVICNPPYGERISAGRNEAERIYTDMGKIFRQNKTWSVYVLTSCEDFETFYGKEAELKRKLYNGALKTDYYQYPGPRPPKI